MSLLTLNIPVLQFREQPEVEFLISKQPKWSNWSRQDLELWICSARRQNLYFIDYYHNGNIKTISFGRRVSQDHFECVMFCGDISSLPSMLLKVDKKYKVVTFLRNKRRVKINLDRLRKHYGK